MINLYSRHMGDVNLFEQMLSYYPVPRKSVKWTTKFIYYMLQMCLKNAHFLYLRHSTDQKKLDLVNFQNHIAKALMEYVPNEWAFTGVSLTRAPDLPIAERMESIPEADQPDDLRIDDTDEKLFSDVSLVFSFH